MHDCFKQSLFLKRCVDLVYASGLLLLFSPLFLFIAVLVKVTSRGPLFYAQERMGWNRRRFKMYKFRSMELGAETQTGPVWAQPQDRRTTPLGRWLRRTSMDELPQFFNVLKGDMSCVGPRPERPVFVEKFEKEVPDYGQRLIVPPGITGWAQIHDLRGNTDIYKRAQYDLYYIKHWSLWMDFKIMLLTFFRIFFSKNAY